MIRSRPVARAVLAASVVLALLSAPLLILAGCESKPRPRPRSVQAVVRDVPAPLRGTVGTMATFNGIEPMFVSGYGVVVGLNGTGGGTLQDTIAASIEREMAQRGINSFDDFEASGIRGRSPRDMLRDRNVAVVLVMASIAPGSPEGTTFDAYVSALNATSLEGGRLWTTDLRMGPPTTGAGPQTRRLATARGPIFINPFAADPARASQGVLPTEGRVLSGGVVTDPLRIELQLDNASHALARAVATAINTRFPEGPGDRGPAARGRNAGSIALEVPAAYTAKPDDFINLVRFMPVNPALPEAYAKRYTEALKNEPGMSFELSWCLEALGEKAIPFIRPLYEHPELGPRVAALRAGARLGDPQVGSFLIRSLKEDNGALRLAAIELLRDLDAGPGVDLALRDLLSSRELLVRVWAYEALAKRAERVSVRQSLLSAAGRDSSRVLEAASRQDVLLRGTIPLTNAQGIRRDVLPDKCYVDYVPAGEPLIYITQQGTPKIVLFGADLALRRPLLVSAWSDRFMLTADSPQEQPRLYYRDEFTRRVIKESVSPELPGLITFMAHAPTPEDPRPGLDFSYSQLVGALYAIQQSQKGKLAFATEIDKLQAQLYESFRGSGAAPRPDTDAERQDLLVFEAPEETPNLPAQPPGQPTPAEPRKPKIVPIRRPGAPK